VFVLLAQAENNLTVKRFQRSQQHKLQAFLLTLQSPDPAQLKRAREEVIRIRKQLQEIFQNTLLLYSNVHAGAIQLSQKTVTEILINFGPPKYEGEYEQITQLVRAIEAADSWEVGQADEKAREAIYLATEIKLRRTEAADELLFDKAFHQVVKGAEKISVEAASDQEGFDLCHTSSEDSSAGFENSDLPLQEDKSPEVVASVPQEDSEGGSTGPDTDSESEPEEPRTPSAACFQQQPRQPPGKMCRQQDGLTPSMMGGKMCCQQDGQTTVVGRMTAQPSASQYPDPRPMQRKAVLATAVQKVGPPKRSHNHAGYPFHAPRLARAMNASMGKELVGQLQEAETAQESNKKAKK